ncbi:MAG TPA: type II CRISPR-associated endonuclease Cas1 [bacterium]|nr:type II CRISPR-associated endonuclease Cas1 [bacterium]HPG47396.1 type II CRISPR-associated endonuclease Cas1 [bacterium]HPM99691.1 type II CRISPR-associated endonuclease Cas1 [bacterium]
MIKRTVYIGNAASVRVQFEQLRIVQQERESKVPIEDLGFLILDHYGITLSHGALASLLENNVAVIMTDERHLPLGIFMPLRANKEQSSSFRAQIEAPLPLKKRLWQQTIKAKIKNQAFLLDQIGLEGHPLHSMSEQVLSGDSSNQEAAAAKVYWQLLFEPRHFKRHRDGKPPNNLLNYGYAILRGIVARSLSGTGLLPMLGIHHCNQYNPFPLADDVMEPYRPYVDQIVWELMREEEIDYTALTPEIKQRFLELPSIGVMMNGQAKPLHLATARTAASLKDCLNGEKKMMVYPQL